MHLRPLSLLLLALPALAQTPGEFGLRLTAATLTHRGTSFWGLDANSVSYYQEVNPPTQAVPSLHLALPMGEGALNVDLLYTSKTATLEAVTPALSGGTTFNRETQRAKDLQTDVAWSQPLLHSAKVDFAMTFGLRYAHGRLQGQSETLPSSGPSLGGYAWGSRIQQWGPTTGLQIRVGLGERTSLRSSLRVAMLHGSTDVDALQSMPPSGPSATTRAAYTIREASTTFDGDLALHVAFAKGLDAAFGYEHRELNGATFTGPFVGVNYRF